MFGYYLKVSPSWQSRRASEGQLAALNANGLKSNISLNSSVLPTLWSYRSVETRHDTSVAHILLDLIAQMPWGHSV